MLLSAPRLEYAPCIYSNPPIFGATMSDIKKVVLAYSGGLDTSVICKWIQETYDCEVVTFTADLGQGEEVEPARAKAEAMGIKGIYIDDLREEFVRDFVYPMFNLSTMANDNDDNRARNRRVTIRLDRE